MSSEKTSAAARVRARIDKLRDEIASRERERAEILSAPLPLEEIRANASASVEALAARWDSPARSLTIPGGRVGELALPDFALGRSMEQSLEGLLARLFGQQLEELLVSEAARCTQGRSPGLPGAERPERVAELDAQIFALELAEEAEIAEAESAGLELDRRADADPSAVLGLPRQAA